MPFPAGTVVLCQQGNVSPPGRTHFKENNRHALDLSNPTIPDLAVIAAAPGRVAHVYADSDPTDVHAGFGYGNHVKIEHGGSYFTMYAHLERVVVRAGDVVDTAAPIGTVGFTGAAGNRHLHFSLHQGNPQGMGVLETTSMDALVTADVAEPTGFRAMSSGDLRDGRVTLWDGALYGSENRAGAAIVTGPAAPELAASLSEGRRSLAQAIADRKTLDTIAESFMRREVEWAEALLTPILARAPRHAVARYWRATAVDLLRRRVDEAEAAYRELLASGALEPTWETWLVSWSHNRLGVIALRRGAVDEARARFLEGARRATAEPERAFALAELEKLSASKDAGR